MDSLYQKFYKKIEVVSLDFKRNLMGQIQWDARLIGIKGARGVGKTTLLLQYIKENLPIDESTLYVSLDNIWFAENKLSTLTEDFEKKGGKYLWFALRQAVWEFVAEFEATGDPCKELPVAARPLEHAGVSPRPQPYQCLGAGQCGVFLE